MWPAGTCQHQWGEVSLVCGWDYDPSHGRCFHHSVTESTEQQTPQMLLFLSPVLSDDIKSGEMRQFLHWIQRGHKGGAGMWWWCELIIISCLETWSEGSSPGSLWRVWIFLHLSFNGSGRLSGSGLTQSKGSMCLWVLVSSSVTTNKINTVMFIKIKQVQCPRSGSPFRCY